MTNRYTEAVVYLEQYVKATADELCKDNQKLLDMPSELDYCIEILKSQPVYEGE